MKISYVCLIYKSTKWLKFVYEQFYKHTILNEGDEFYFVANDACDEVLNYLTEHKIPHYIHNNNEEQKKEWYINNVYRAWNTGAQKAKGDYIIFLNSDMAFSADWNINLIKYVDENKCINSRLIERGPPNGLPTMVGGHGIEHSFGDNYNSFDEKSFNDFSLTIKEPKIIPNGLYMPMIIKKAHLELINYYPEGNISVDNWSKLLECPIDKIKNFEYEYMTPKDVYELGLGCVPGDKVLMKKMEMINVYHYTSFESIVYHFQQGEMSE
jgi:glycosyltransferase involved in cell wall biosynthesis